MHRRLVKVIVLTRTFALSGICCHSQSIGDCRRLNDEQHQLFLQELFLQLRRVRYDGCRKASSKRKVNNIALVVFHLNSGDDFVFF